MTTKDCYESEEHLLLLYVFLIPRFKMKSWPPFGICFFLWGKEKEWPSPMMALKASAQLWHLSLLPVTELHIGGQRNVLLMLINHMTIGRTI